MAGSPASGSPPFTPRAKKVLELSLREALQLGHSYIGTEHILLGLVREDEGVAATILVGLGADLERVRQKLMQLISGFSDDVTRAVLDTAGSEAWRQVHRVSTRPDSLRLTGCCPFPRSERTMVWVRDRLPGPKYMAATSSDPHGGFVCVRRRRRYRGGGRHCDRCRGGCLLQAAPHSYRRSPRAVSGGPG
jgi:Clp amino terminal domain, pathogenicity island component